MRLSLNTNYLCTIKCEKKHVSHSDDLDTEYEALVTWARDGRQERWKLVARTKYGPYNGTKKFIYSFEYESVTVPANRVTPEDDRHILSTYFPKMEAGKTILATTFRNEDFPITCVWGGRRLCTLHCRKEDIFSPDVKAAMRGETVAEDNHILATSENLTVYNLVVKWGPHQPDESWTLQVSWEGYKPKTVREFKCNGPSSPVTGVKEDPELNAQGCKIADLLQRLGAMRTV
jgi:hypothetical protein